MIAFRNNPRNECRLFAAAAAVALMAAPVFAGTNDAGTLNQEVTISVSGSTALKNFITGQGFTDLAPGNSITLNIGGTLAAAPTTFTAGPGGLELAPTVLNSVAINSTNALRVEYHESGSVEGILELANDQIGPVSYVENNIDRNPNGGNAVWVNGNQIGGVSAPNGNSLTPPNNNPNGNYLGPFYGENSTGTVTTFGSNVNATFANFGVSTASGVVAAVVPGVNVSPVDGTTYTQAGQNAVQLAISDVVPVQAFANTSSAAPTAGEPWLSTPQNDGYGLGNTKLAAGGLGVAKGQVNLQSAMTLNMPAAATNPRTGGTFGGGPWNSAGLGNLNSQTTAVSATLFVANPGTGLDRLDQTDAQWLQTTGRLANGAAFEMTTRDVNSGTRNVSSLDIGIDPSWSVGIDDSGNGNTATGATSQIDVGSAQFTLGSAQVTIGNIRYSNKTAGGAQLRPTVQNARMAVGTLSVGDANGVFASGNAYGLRALDYSTSSSATGASASYVQVSGYSIITGQYALYQNEQFVTLKAPQTDDSSFNTLSAAQWAAVSTNGSVAMTATMSSAGTVPIQGDDSTGAVSQVINNVQLSEATLSLSTFNTPAFSYFTKGFILPEDMAAEKPENGLNESTLGFNPYGQNTTQTTQYLSSSFTVNVTGSDPDTITAHAGDVYGGKGTNVSAFQGSISQTVSNNANGANDGGNWLFGNFNQNGIRDFDSVVVTGEAALAALESSAAGNNSQAGLANSTVIIPAGTSGVLAPLGSMVNEVGGIGATKGDLIMMGDYDGRGVFDGLSLYELATGAAIANATTASNPLAPGVNDHLTLQSEALTVLSPNARDGSTGMQTSVATTVNTETFGDAVRRGQLYKNTALDYLNSTASTQMKEEAAAVLSIPGSTAPAGATLLGLGADINGGPLVYFTYDPTGSNSYNKSDVNRDGVVDINDAVVVDNNNGQDYTNLADTLNATEPTPVTGLPEPLNLVLAAQTDYSTVIGSADLNVVNTALAANGNANWYSYNVQKTGPGNIIWGRTAGIVNVSTAASLQVSNGSFIANGTVDPFGGPGAGNHVALTIDSGGKVQFNQQGQTAHVSALSINTAEGSAFTIEGVGGINVMFTGADPSATIAAYLASGYNGGSWTGPGINSTLAASTPHFTVGYLEPGDPGGTAGDFVAKTTLAGDANLDGNVSIADLLIVAQNFGQTGKDWAHANFTYDANGSVGIADLLLVAQNFSKSTAIASSTDGQLSISSAWELATPSIQNTTAVNPEPTSLGLFLGSASLLIRRRRRSMR